MSQYPVDAVLSDLDAALALHRRVVLEAPPGAGKTTRIPPSLLDTPWLAGQTIVMLEPRRLAARAAASRISELLGEPLGRRVGYRVRLDSRVSAQTRIEVVTEGILTRRLQSDPELKGVGLVIFDEFHERQLQGDLGLALCRDIQSGVREELRILVMSATLDGVALAETLDAVRLVSRGHSYPVDLHHTARDPEGPLWVTAANAIRRVLTEQQSGDVLVFLPGAGEIRRCAEGLGGEPEVEIHPLFGDLPPEIQERAIRPSPEGRRKVVIATNIAETSLTIEGVTTVIDSGWARTSRFDPRSGLTRLETVRISAASATQRAGRAGRLGPGTCYRLYSERTLQGMPAFHPPEIVVADLAPLALELAAWGVRQTTDLPWVDSPPAAALQQARDLLGELGALDREGRITPLGREMVGLPVHPRLSRMMLIAKVEGRAALACDLAALLSERDLLRGAAGRGSSDLTARLEALVAYRHDGGAAARLRDADPGACRVVDRIAGQWRRTLGAGKTVDGDTREVGRLLLLAYPERLAQRRSGREARFVLSGGRGGWLDVSDPLAEADYLAVASIDGKGREGRIRLAAPVTGSIIEECLGDRIDGEEAVQWEVQEERVVARRVTRFGAIELKSSCLDEPDPERVLQALIAGIRQMGIEVLPWSHSLRRFQARVEFLRCVDRGGAWPDLSDSILMDSLEEWLGPFLIGHSSRAGLRKVDLSAALRTTLDWSALRRLEEGAPERIDVPSGHRRPVDYRGSDAVLAIKLQELFGLARTPSVAWGRVPLTLHLLSPAGRPIQVTRDLSGFWQRTYPEVKKELKGRYPKHPWPNDPCAAKPTAGVKKRGSR
ncbi:ATP-dependent helicase HrpB [Thiohalomonas denitrificans]|uniref:ATP-dependent helicase HrpB n=1 Tax=Thiohalomonas denitrificans TaxID=415747 RepID=UPI0026EF73DD|nr:ATP-dependent helicase HrpB [Thiohalomonas denitrificans]